jgi:hypothetical protein
LSAGSRSGETGMTWGAAAKDIVERSVKAIAVRRDMGSLLDSKCD